jgi:hypothetical protein
MPAEPVPLCRAERARVAAASLGAAILFWLPAVIDPASTGFGDWQMIHHNWEVGYVALTRFGEWPLWDPFHCGGITMWGNPESQHLSPFFFLSFVVGTTFATKIMVVAHTWAGLAGMYVLARRHFHLRPPAAAYAAALWCFSGYFAWQISGGHATFISFYLAPWVLLAWRAACADWRWSAALAALMALVAFEGGTYPFPYFVLLLAFDSVVQLVRGVGVARVLGAATLSGALTMALSAARWIPSLLTLARVPRQIDETDAIMPWEIPSMLLRWSFPWRHPDHPYVWPEYSAYIGVAGTVLAVAGTYLALRRRRYEAVAGMGFFAAFMLGHITDWAPWALLHELPIYRSLRVPSRFAVLFLFYLALVAGLAAQELLPRVLASTPVRRWTAHRPKAARALPALLVGLLVLEPLVYGLGVNNRWHRDPIDTSATAERFHLIRAQDYALVYASLPRRNQGTPTCYVGNLDWPISGALWLGPVPQVRVSDAPGTVEDWDMTANRVEAHVRLEGPGRVTFNQNHDPDWRSNVGEVVEDRGRLAVDLPPGAHELKLRYLPAHLHTSFALSGAGAIAALLLGGMAYRRRRGPAAARAE